MKLSIPWLTLGVGLFFALLLLRFNPLNTDAGFVLPLLTALLMCELGFILTVFGIGISVKDILKQGVQLKLTALLLGNLLLALNFINQGLTFWAESGGLGS